MGDSVCFEILNTLGDPQEIQILGRFPKSEKSALEKARDLEKWCIHGESIWNRRLLNRNHNRRHNKDDILYRQYDEFVLYEEMKAC